MHKHTHEGKQHVKTYRQLFFFVICNQKTFSLYLGAHKSECPIQWYIFSWRFLCKYFKDQNRAHWMGQLTFVVIFFLLILFSCDFFYMVSTNVNPNYGLMPIYCSNIVRGLWVMGVPCNDTLMSHRMIPSVFLPLYGTLSFQCIF